VTPPFDDDGSGASIDDRPDRVTSRARAEEERAGAICQRVEAGGAPRSNARQVSLTSIKRPDAWCVALRSVAGHGMSPAP